MATKLDRKTLPAGTNASDFKYMGRAAIDQGDFGSDVGIADCACVDQFGTSDHSKFYHGGVVQHTGNSRWYVVLEWGRIKAGNSWSGNTFMGGDFQFVEAFSEADARSFFASQMAEKNTKRLSQKSIGGRMIWAAKEGKDGYLVQRLSTRSRGLPDAYTIKDSTGVKVTAPVASVVAVVGVSTGSVKQYQPQVVALAKSLLGGTKDYARAASASTGITPTLAAIQEVRDECIPIALKLLQKVGADVKAQLADSGLRDLSKYVASQVPRVIPRGGDPMAILLTTENIFALQQDLDAFESSLKTEDFSTASAVVTSDMDPDKRLNANLRWLDPASDLGRWVTTTYCSMNKNVHSHLNGRKFRVLNVFEVVRPDRDAQFLQTVRTIAAKRKGQNRGDTMPELQPATRPDISDVAEYVKDAGVFLGVHGTRAVNIHGILSTNFRLPSSLSGVQIAGSAFSAGTYFADSIAKSHGYVGDSGSIYGSSNGGIAGRGFFMFLCDVAGGKFHYPRSTMWGATSIPGDADSIYAHPRYCSSLANNEYVIHNPSGQQRIRYLVEAKLD